MASQKSKRRSRKPRSARRAIGAAGGGAPGTTAGAAGAEAAADEAPVRVTPRVAATGRPATTRRQQREERERRAARDSAQASRTLGTYGERPRSIFNPIPVSEIAIFAGMIAVVVGFINQDNVALSVGAIVCALGVLEFTAREHFSGYRSHATLLAAFPAIIVEVLLAIFVGIPTQRILLLAPVVPVFALSFWLLHRSFAGARHARVARPPGP